MPKEQPDEVDRILDSVAHDAKMRWGDTLIPSVDNGDAIRMLESSCTPETAKALARARKAYREVSQDTAQ